MNTRHNILLSATALVLCLGCDDNKATTKPAPEAASKSAASAATKARSAKEAKPQAAATKTAKVRQVPSKEWIPKVGPKLPPGATVAHKVFEGWPKEKSLFVITKEKDQYKARVFDDRVYPTVSWGISGAKAKSINAVSFFDADGDGNPDAVVVATFDDKGANKTFNGMFKWTGTSIEPMQALADKVGVHDTIADIKKKLGK